MARAEYFTNYDDLTKKNRRAAKRLKQEIRANSYNRHKVDHGSEVGESLSGISRHYAGLFMVDAFQADLRYLHIPANSIKRCRKNVAVDAFFFWAIGHCIGSAGETISYTNNWPSEKLVAMNLRGSLLLWKALG
jgi:nitric oxide reductase subunit B